MQPVPLATLQQYCDQMLSSLRPFDAVAHALYHTMRNTGLRFEDCYNTDRWRDNGNSTFSVATAKHSNTRTIPYSLLSPLHLQRLTNNTPHVFPYSYTQYLRYYARFFPAPRLMCRHKPIKTHLFRHLKAKELKASGVNDANIQAYLGERQLSSAQQYIYSTIYDAAIL
ncbi:MAG: hypothetical protein LBG47_10650 [Prevotellaceae bacterium]|jgi:integrase|nr:hypothetical protein [Prevotellaceae bacterium]